MAFTPISHTVPQYHNNGSPASGFVLKAYSSGTLTNISMATDSTGGTTAATITLNAQGYPAVSGTVVIPYINEKYKLALYATQAAADADTSPIWIPDTIPIGGELGAVTQNLSSTTSLTASDVNNHIAATGTITITLPDVANAVGSGYVVTIRNAGTGLVTIDGTGAETINGALTLVLLPGDSAMFISSSTATDEWSTVGLEVSRGWTTQRNVTLSADSSVDFQDGTSGVDLTTDEIRIRFKNVVMGTDAVALRLQFSVDNGSTFLSCNAHFANPESSGTGYVGVVYTNNVPAPVTNIGNVSGESINGMLLTSGLDSSVFKHVDVNMGTTEASGAFRLAKGGIAIPTTSAVDFIRIIASSGTLSTGTIIIEGRNY